MAQGTCKTSDCGAVGSLVRGWCRPCYRWASRHGWADPAGRQRPVPGPADGQCTIVEAGVKCVGAHKVHGMCDTHRLRMARSGHPLITRKSGNGVVQAALTAAANADTDECIFVPRREGRVSIQVDGVRSQASRVVWTIRHGDPGDQHVLHSCNNGSGAHGCVNVRHLRLGTNSENVLEARDAGVAVGESHYNHKLTEAEVREIRERAAAGETHASLAEEYGVGRTTVTVAVGGKTWRRVS